ncbi:MAG: hypothetical protein U0270_14185 [Labilithrix sp.]
MKKIPSISPVLGVVSLSLGLTAVGVLAAGCSASADDVDRSESAVHAPPLDEAKELDSILGDDRVARYLHANPRGIPGRFGQVEEAYGIGSKCNRTDSHEIWTVEEKDTRITGAQVEMPDLMPRVVVGGCQQTLGNFRDTFELTVAMVSSNVPTDINDAIPDIPVEFMALDNTTGLFNFYVLEPTPGSDNGTVARFVRLADGTVQKWTKIPGKAATKEDFPQGKCFNCHVHGGPVMNELTEPWTNWVSQHHELSRPMTGYTHALVSESRPFPGDTHTRSTLAQDLERVTRASIAMWVEGIPGVPGSGIGQQTLDGKQPGGVSKLLRSVFCESEVNYASVLHPDAVPTPLFLDQSIADLAGLQPAVAPFSGADWTLLPVRSETDQRIEKFLIKRGILKLDTVNAARVFDDMHDIFSAKRCALHEDATARLAPGVTPDTAVRESILASLDKDDADRKAGKPSTTTAPQRAYIRALLSSTITSEDRDSAEAAYISDVTARFQAEATKLESATGLAELSKRWTDRQAAARAMFPKPENMLPLTHPPPAVVADNGGSTH